MRILIVEDDPKTSSFVAKGLQQHGYAADIAVDGAEGVEMVLTGRYDAAIVDLTLPHMDGFAVIDAMRRDEVATPVIVLSARRSVEDKVRCLRAGADDYLAKPFALSELLARIEAILRRAQKSADLERIEAHGVVVDLIGRTVRREGQKIELQPREFSLLELLIRNEGRALAKTHLLERLWDYNFDPQTNVVDVLVCRLRTKLDRDYQPKLIHTLRGIGYIFRVE